MKIAIVGSQPASIQLAPYDDPEWQIWGCSPGAYPIAGLKSDVWFEIHRFEPQIPAKVGSGQPWFTVEYIEFLVRHKGKVVMSEPLPPEVTNAVALPKDALIEKYGPFFFTSSIAWMAAMALDEIERQREMDGEDGEHEIGFWGVDMSATEEYGAQRPGLHYFIQEAMKRNIRVVVPPESDLLQPPFMYGVTENHPMMVKLTARMRELQNNKAHADQQAAAFNQRSVFLAGAIDDLQYIISTWVTFQTNVNPVMGKTGNEVRADRLTDGNSSAPGSITWLENSKD